MTDGPCAVAAKFKYFMKILIHQKCFKALSPIGGRPAGILLFCD